MWLPLEEIRRDPHARRLHERFEPRARVTVDAWTVFRARWPRPVELYSDTDCVVPRCRLDRRVGVLCALSLVLTALLSQFR